jgi:hypothetical protein
MRTAILVLALATLSSRAEAAPGSRHGREITIASSSDRSPGVLDEHARRQHGEIVRRALLDVLHRSGADMRHAEITAHQIDASIVSWRVTPSPTQVAVAVELRVVVCDDRGQMRSIVTGRARVSAPMRGASRPWQRPSVR